MVIRWIWIAVARSATAIRCSALFCGLDYLGVVKPHGRLGPLRLEPFTGRPRAAYRRGGLPRPFRRLKASGEFILGRASHLDAFSGYHSRPSLPGVAPGGTTGTRAGRPTRSSRTRVRSPQLSNATTDTDRTVSRRSEPSSCTTLTGEQPDPWDLLQPQDVISRHRGAKPRRRCELSGAISLLSPAYLLSVAR